MEKSRSRVSGIKESVISPISLNTGQSIPQLFFFFHFQPSHFKKNREKQKGNQIRYGEETDNHEKDII